jgi:hypothetical protein
MDCLFAQGFDLRPEPPLTDRQIFVLIGWACLVVPLVARMLLDWWATAALTAITAAGIWFFLDSHRKRGWLGGWELIVGFVLAVLSVVAVIRLVVLNVREAHRALPETTEQIGRQFGRCVLLALPLIPLGMLTVRVFTFPALPGAIVFVVYVSVVLVVLQWRARRKRQAGVPDPDIPNGGPKPEG